MTPAQLRIVICDATPGYALALGRYLEHDPAIAVAATFTRSEHLLRQIRGLAPDLLIIDANPSASVRAIERIMAEVPVPILALGDVTDDGATHAAAALAAGALEAADKANIRVDTPTDLWATAMRSRVKRLASVKVRPSHRGRRQSPVPRIPALDRPARVVGIGASTGGPPALASVLGDLPADSPLTVLVVQHISPGFGSGLVSWLDGCVGPPVRTAADGALAAPGIWLAPDDAHLTLGASLRFAIDAKTRRGGHRPSVDVLFESLAASVGEGTVGIVLTGMGRDGAAGVEAIRAAGGLVIAQDEETSAVFGMPRAAIEAGADIVLALSSIGPALGALRTRRLVA